MSDPTRVNVFTIPSNRSFSDALAAGLIARFGKDLLGLARGRILLPNNRAVRAVTEAFVRASGGGLLLPRLIPIGDPDIGERIGGALEPIGHEDPVPPAIDPLHRLLLLAEIVGAPGLSTGESLRLAQDLARTLDAMLVEEVEPARLAEAAADAGELARHWQVSLERLRAIIEIWPRRLRDVGLIDLAERRNRLLSRLAGAWASRPPNGFTVAAGITTAAPAVARLLNRVARMEGGMVILPGLSLARDMPDDEWQRLGAEGGRRAELSHPQFHLKLLLLDRIGISRDEVQVWPSAGRAASPAVRGRAVANAMTGAEFSHKWSSLAAPERRLSGIRMAEFADGAAEAQGIALALREALETSGRTAALVTPDRLLAQRVSALLKRWGVDADDSAGRALSDTPIGTLLLGIAAAAAEQFAPVPLLALIKHPLVGGEDDERRQWLDDVRTLDLAMRGPRPASGLEGIERHIREKDADRGHAGYAAAWAGLRPSLDRVAALIGDRATIGSFIGRLVEAATALAGERAWRGTEGRMAAELLGELQSSSAQLALRAEDAVPVLRSFLSEPRVRPPYGGHPRIFIWGLLEARLQHADLMILGGLNEGTWPAAPAADPWLAPKIRSNLGLPGTEFRAGLSAHDFASALGAPQVLITRARRDGRAPTVASRLWLRLEAMTGGVTRATVLQRWTAALDEPVATNPVGTPAPSPPAEARPKEIWVTAVDRLKADPFAFYAREILKLPKLDPVDAEHSAAWKGSAVHEVLQQWLEEDHCDPDKLIARTEALLSRETIHPMLRALWAPRLTEAIRWIEKEERRNQAAGRLPLAAERKGSAAVAGVQLHGRADRIDRLVDQSLAIVDYKTGKAPGKTAVEEGFSLQLGLLGLIAQAGGFDEIKGEPRAFEYWSLTKYGNEFGRCVRPDKDMGPDEFLTHAGRNFAATAGKWLTGSEPFTAKLNPAYAPYGDYDQLMRLEEWYGRK